MKNIKASAVTISRIISLITILTGCLVLVGWVFDITVLKSIFPGIVPMRFNAAICFMITGFILFLIDHPAMSRRRKTVVAFLSSFLILVGLLVLSQFIFGWNLGIDELLWKEGPGNIAPTVAGRIGFVACINFILLGIIFLLIIYTKSHRQFILLLIFILFFVSVFITYIDTISIISVAFNPLSVTMAFNAALLFIVFFIGLFHVLSLRDVRIPFSVKLAGYFIIIILMFIMLFIANTINIKRVKVSDSKVEQSHAELSYAQKLNTAIDEVNVFVLRYVYSLNTKDLESYQIAADSIKQYFVQLKTLKKEYVDELTQLGMLENRLDSCLQTQHALFTIRQRAGLEPALSFIKNSGIDLMFGRIHRLQNEQDEQEKEFLALLIIQNENNMQHAVTIINLFQLIVFLMFLASVIMILKNYRLKHRITNDLERSMKFTEALLYAIPIPVFFKDNQGRYLGCNKAFSDQMGIDQQDIIGKTASALWPDAQSAVYAQKDRQLLADNKQQIYEGTVTDKHKRVLDVVFFKQVFLDEKSRIAGIVGAYVDISERKRSAAELKENETFLLEITSIAHLGTYVWDIPTGNWTSSEILDGIFGIDKSYDRNPAGWKRLLHPDMQDKVMDHLSTEVLGKHQRFDLEYKIIRPDNGRMAWLHGIGKLELDSNHQPAKLIGTISDITERKQNQEKMQQLSQAVNQSPVCIVITDTSGDIEYVNPKYNELTGYSNEEIIGQNNRILKSGYTKPWEYKTLWDTISSGREWHGEFNNKKKNGDLYWESASISPVTDAAGKITHYLAVKEDITERKRLNDARIAAVERHSLLAEFAPYCIHEIDLSGNISFMNKAGLQMLGVQKMKEVIGVPYLSLVGSADRPRVEALLQDALSGKQILFEFETDDGKFYQASFVPLPDRFGKVERIMGISIDLTGSKHTQAMLKRYTAELEVSNSELEHFAYAASHDLQEPLRMVKSFLTLLEKQLDGRLDETTQKYIHFAVDGANRMKVLIKDLLEYSRVGTNKEDFAATDMDEVMQYVKSVIYSNQEHQRAIINVNPLPVIIVNKTLIGQLFINLVGNGLKYNDHEVPEIEIGCVEEKEDYIFYVKDNGIGIDAKFHQNIFIIFKRLHTDKAYTGSGIGLAVCKKIIDIHQGKIWLESEPGKGSTFYFSLLKTGINKNRIEGHS